MSYFGSYEFTLAVSRGLVPGHKMVRKFGENAAINNAEELVWLTGGAYVFPTTAAVVTITHGGNDVAGGTGARKVMVEGLDANWVSQSEEVTLGAGATTATSNTFIRCFRAYVSDAGTYAQTYSSPFGTNDAALVGDIGGDNQFTIGAGLGQTLTTNYTVAANKTAYLTNINVTTEATKTVKFAFYQRRDADDTSAPISGRRVVRTFESGSGSFALPVSFTDAFPAKTDLWMTGLGSAGGDSVSAEYTLILVDD